ncbi:MAG: RagB/SusD family nutrient uptake outer membrane protein [Limnohabitans sp.]|nr:RagB/SusD family nutrient uptake outer membrane protein [Limnohabitans sp.]
MKHNILKSILILAAFTIIGCTNDFNETNTDSTGISSLPAPELFKKLYLNVFITDPAWQYQLQQNLNADLWSGYMATPTPFAGGSNNSTYNFMAGWNDFAWKPTYLNIMAFADAIERKTKGKQDDFYALSLILKVEAMHRLTDIFGPAVYSEYGKGILPANYDSQEEIYNKMFSELDFAIATLTAKIQSGTPTNLKGIDSSTLEGDMTKWVKFANSLRLRLAMRISKVNNALAKTQAEKSATHSIGLMTDNANNVTLAGASHPLNTIGRGWGDIKMSANMESILVGLNDSRIGKFFDKSSIDPTKYKGIRSAIELKEKADHSGFSDLSSQITSKITFMTAAEVYFLRAEGALRGWNMGGGTAQSYYEEGVRKSFEQHGLALSAANTYLADNTSVPANYVDIATSGTGHDYSVNNATAISNVTIQWDNADSNERKLEKIITQKWIACFPDGQEAWSEYRRTGYPKLFPALKNTSGGIIDSNLGPRRINFPISEVQGNPAGVATGKAKLGGADTGATRLWWDTTSPNF